MTFQWINELVNAICQTVGFYFPRSIYTFGPNVNALLAIILISVVCGSVGSLVVGNRMAFFSDALAHCAFAGVGLGLLIGLLTNTGKDWFEIWITPIMIVFGALLGLGIALVREKTSQANDTIIGVFFAGAIGLGAVFLKAGMARRYMPPENFLFGDLVSLKAEHLVELSLLSVGVLALLLLMYNSLVFASFSPTLARSRGIPLRVQSYIFIILLALIVNLCLKTVGVLLINAFLIVPAATAANVCRNMRQLFPVAIGLCLFAGVTGQNLSWNIGNWTREAFVPGESGAIVVVAVGLYFLSILIKPLLVNRRSYSLATEKGLQT